MDPVVSTQVINTSGIVASRIARSWPNRGPLQTVAKLDQEK